MKVRGVGIHADGYAGRNTYLNSKAGGRESEKGG